MDQGFVDILNKLTTEQGKEALLNHAKCKAFLADYTRGEYKKESRLLLQALEAGVQKAIDATGELGLCKQQQARVLREEHFLTEEAAADAVDTLALVLRGEQVSGASLVCSNCGKELQKEWKACPYCSTPAAKTAQASGSAAQASYEKGKRYYENEDYDTAIAEFTEAIRLDPSYADAYRCRGDAYQGKGQYNKAIKDLTEAIRLDPDNADAYFSRGDAYNWKEQYNKAIKDLTEAIRLDPDIPLAYAWRGNAYKGKGQYDMAIKDLTEAIRLEPDNLLAYAWRGEAWSQLGKRNQAIQDLEKVLSMNPGLEWAKEELRELRR